MKRYRVRVEEVEPYVDDKGYERERTVERLRCDVDALDIDGIVRAIYFPAACEVSE